MLQDYDFKLRTVRAGLYVRRESNQVFESLTFNQPELEKSLPPYDLNNSQIRNTFNIGERFYAYAKFDFLYSDGAKGSVFVIRERSPFGEVTRSGRPSRSGTTGSAFPKKRSPTCSSAFTERSNRAIPRRAAAVWDFPSPAKSSRDTAATSG